jgi:hypothetical protein
MENLTSVLRGFLGLARFTSAFCGKENVEKAKSCHDNDSSFQKPRIYRQDVISILWHRLLQFFLWHS